jgi:SAM-dependent methyltransferase
VSDSYADWLSLREPADLAARNPAVLAACAEAFAGRQSVEVHDVGAGTGAALRAVAEKLPRRQRWILIDRSATHLRHARTSLFNWADTSHDEGDSLHLMIRDHCIEVVLCERDLAAGADFSSGRADLVSASALLDIMTADWLEEFIATLIRLRVPVLATLTFDGTVVADPPHALDAAVAEAFRQHQQRQQALGRMSGPRAADLVEGRLRDAGFDVVAGDAPWLIDGQMPALKQSMIDGIAAAAGEMALLAPESIANWRADRSRDTRLLTIGHRDLFAAPRQG